MSKRPYVIKVTGRIFSASANNYAQDWQAGGIASLSMDLQTYLGQKVKLHP